MAAMRALRIQIEAVTSSFRFPKVQTGQLPTFDMPPPATIYGHLAGVLGEWFEPDGLEFAYVFRHAGKAFDLETAHPIERGSQRPTYQRRGWAHPVNVACETNIQRRQFLLWPRMTLYLRGHDQLLLRFANAFPSPYYSYVLGRSQDLATCRGAEMIELDESADAYFADTILPYAWRPVVGPGTTVMMPSAINYYRQRAALMERYVQVTTPPLRIYNGSRDTISRASLPEFFPVDRSDTRDYEGRRLPRGLWFHRLGGPGQPECG